MTHAIEIEVEAPGAAATAPEPAAQPAVHLSYLAPARAAFERGDHAEVIALCEAALARQREAPEALMLLGLVSFELEQPQEALTLVERAHHAAPEVREFADALSCVLARLGHDSEGLYYAKLATILTPHPEGAALLPDKFANYLVSLRDTDSTLFQRRAACALDKGDYAAALRDGQKQLASHPATLRRSAS